MIFVSLSSPSYDINGTITFEIIPNESELESLERRVNRSQNMDGSVTILDNGFVQGDRTITITAELSQAQFDRVKYLFRKYTSLILTAPDGAYTVSMQTLNNQFGRVSMTLLVSASLTDYRPYTTTTTTSTSSSTSSSCSSSSSSCSTASTASTQSSTSSSSSTKSTQSTTSSSSTSTSTQTSSSTSTSTVTCDYNEFFTSSEKWQVESQTTVNYSIVSDSIQFEATGGGAGNCQLIYKWQIANGDFDIRIDIPLHDGGVIQGYLSLTDADLSNTNRVFIRYLNDGAWKVFSRAKINGVNQTSAEAVSTCEKIRIVRNGTNVSTYYYKNSQWYLLRTDDFGAFANNLKAIRLRADSTGVGSDRVRFDNLVFWGGCPDGTYQWTSTSSTQSTTSSTSSSSTSTFTSSSSSCSTTTTSPP